jgi:hypothetical protein
MKSKLKREKSKYMKNYMMDYRKTMKGVLYQIFFKEKNRCKKYNYELSYSLDEFIEMFINDPLYIKIYTNWKNNGYKHLERPSVDRDDPFKGYTKDNITMMTWGENKEKGYKEVKLKTRIPISLFDMNNKKIREFISITEASQIMGISAGNISLVLNNKRSHAGGFKFNRTEEIISNKEN